MQIISLSKEKRQDFYITGLVYAIFFISAFVIEIMLWHDSAATAFRKYVLGPAVIFLSLYRAVEYFHNGLYERIIISDDSIEYQSLGMGIKAKWNELGIIENSARLFGKFEVIPVIRENMRTKTIPIGQFDKEWRSKDLGKQISKYAPNIFKT